MKTLMIAVTIGVVLISLTYWITEDWRAHRQEVVPYREGNQWGFRTRSGKVVVPPQYDEVHVFSEGLAAVKVRAKWGYIDTTGKLVIEPRFGLVHVFSEGRAAVVTDDGYGFIDKKGTLVIAPIYTFTPGFSEGFAVVYRKGGCAIIDPSGKEVIPFGVYEDARNFSEGLSAVKKEGKWGYIDKSRKMVIEPQYDSVGPFLDGRAEVGFGKKRTKYTEIDRTGKQLRPPAYRMK